MRGLGRVYRRGPVWWVAYYYNGQQMRESSHSDKESVAQGLLKKRLGEIGRGKLIGPSAEKVTFEELAGDYLTDYQINGKRSMRSAKLSVSHLREFFGMDRVPQITTARIKKYIAARQEAGAANASINRELAALSKMFSLALESEKLAVRPYIPRLEENNARQGFLDHASFTALRENLPEYLKDPITFLYLSGWRKSEMRSLEWRDIDLAGKVVRLRHEESKNKSGRILPLSGELLNVIERAKNARRLDCSRVFHLDGQPIGDFRKAWRNACRASGINVLVHDLRRTAVRNMVRAGVRERTAMQLTGHKTRSVFDRYDIVDEADLTQAAERLHAHLGQQSTVPTVVSIKQAV